MRVLAIACAFVLAASAQRPEQATGSISGRVLEGRGGPPIRGAAVVVSEMDQGLGMAWSGPDGRYLIENVPVGRYSVIAVKPSHSNYAVRAEVRAGETTRGIDIPMPPSAVLAGRVRDRDGLPVEGAVVRVQRMHRYFGRPTLAVNAVPPTSDRGEFRTSSRAFLDCFLVLQPPSKPDVAGVYRLLHPPLFYPAAVNPAEAQPVRVDPGVKAETFDFETPAPADTAMLILARTSEPGAPARSCTQCRFSLQARHAETWLEVLTGQSDRSGRIEIHGVHPGTYRIAVFASEAGEAFAGYDMVIAEKGQLRRFEVTAWAANHVPVQLTLVDPPEELRDEAAEWAGGLDADLLDPLYPARRRTGVVHIAGRGLAGHGRLPLPPGEWALRLYKSDPLPDKAYIQEVLVGGRPQLGPFVTVTSRGYSSRIEVRIGFATPRLTGRVTPFDPRDPLRPLVRAVADPAGGYSQDASLVVREGGEFDSGSELGPGTYLVYAVSPAARDLDFSDPALRARYAHYGKRVVLEPNGSHRVDLEAIP
jgi:hypothetical protein